jgi:hypothetical protein
MQHVRAGEVLQGLQRGPASSRSGGCDLWISAPDDPRPWRLTLLCQNREGYLNLSRLVSRAWREGQHGGRALVDAGWLNAMQQGIDRPARPRKRDRPHRR